MCFINQIEQAKRLSIWDIDKWTRLKGNDGSRLTIEPFLRGHVDENDLDAVVFDDVMDVPAEVAVLAVHVLV